MGKQSNDYYRGIYKMCSNIYTIFSKYCVERLINDI